MSETSKTPKFKSILLRNESEVIKGRAEKVFNALNRAHNHLIDELTQRKETIEEKMELMLDINPKNKYTMIVGDAVKPDEFVAAYQELAIQLRAVKIELEEAENTRRELYE